MSQWSGTRRPVIRIVLSVAQSFLEKVFPVHTNMADYADYLAEKNKHMKNRHSTEDTLSISFIPVSASRPSQLDAFNQVLAMSSKCDIIELSSF